MSTGEITQVVRSEILFPIQKILNFLLFVTVTKKFFIEKTCIKKKRLISDQKVWIGNKISDLTICIISSVLILFFFDFFYYLLNIKNSLNFQGMTKCFQPNHDDS